MDAEESQTRRPSRKSVAFTEERLEVDADGIVTVISSPDDEDSKNTAMSHTPSTPPLSAALEASKEEAAAAAASSETTPVEEDIGELLPLKKKKKKSKKVAEDADAEDGAAGDEGGADGDEPVLDLGLKKKKKKAKKVAEGEDDFAARIEALDIKEGEEDEQPEQAGDMDKGTGVWQHNESKPITYDLLLQRFFNLLSQKNPDHASGGTRSYKIPPPQCMREGNKKTIFVNLPEICKRMNRSEEHVTAFLFTELGTSGSVDGSRRLVIKGRFQSKQLENVLRKYIIDYVTCKTCRSPETSLSKGENRLYFITCLSCGSRRSVQAIKTGFSAQVGKRKKMQG